MHGRSYHTAADEVDDNKMCSAEEREIQSPLNDQAGGKRETENKPTLIIVNGARRPVCGWGPESKDRRRVFHKLYYKQRDKQ